MMFEKAWRFLKASRQTELGEFHPHFPSSYGPMTLISSQPTKQHLDSWREQWKHDGKIEPFDESMAQPYEAFVHEGMRGKPPSDDALGWEKVFREKQPHIKPFTFEEGDTGNWFRPAMQESPSWVRNHQKMLELLGVGPSVISYGRDNPHRTVGVRMPLDESMGMFRDKGYENESAEAFIYGDIPPERLVMVPGMGNSVNTWPDGLGEVDE